MEFIDKGTKKGSHMYFYTPSQTALRLLLYPICAGEFYCNCEYCVTREQYNSFLVLLVLEGSITFEDDAQRLTAGENELIMLDCYRRHKYYANGDAHTLWLHFDGIQASELFSEIILKNGHKMSISSSVKSCIQGILLSHNEYEMSQMIYKMLISLLNSQGGEEVARLEQVTPALEFIKSNYSSHLSTELIAQHGHMSASHFSKVFKSATGFSPYDYLLSVRLEKAKEMLLNSDMPISEVAYKAGFNSTSNFVYFFKNQVGISPLKFRKMGF